MKDDDYPYKAVASACAHNKFKASNKVESWAFISTSVEDAKAKLMERPLSFAMNATTKDFMLYSNGVFTGIQSDGTAVPTNFNHAMTLVGFNVAPAVTISKIVYTQKCTNWFTFQRCYWEANEVITLVSPAINTWKAQNTWGTDWGMSGFIDIEIQGGEGVGGMNKAIQYVSPL